MTQILIHTLPYTVLRGKIRLEP